MKLALTFAPALLSLALASHHESLDDSTTPAGCTGNLNGKFEITVAKSGDQKRSMPEKRADCAADGAVVITLKDGQIIDAKGRVGYIASNYQFQFDSPAQFGALITGGFSICEGNTLALGSSKTFFKCRSGDFYNLYDRTWAPQCKPASLIAVPCGSEDTVSQRPDGQIIGTTAVETAIITAIADGQPQVIATTVAVPVYSTWATTTPLVSEYSDGQLQVPTAGSSKLTEEIVSSSMKSTPVAGAPTPNTSTEAHVTAVVPVPSTGAVVQETFSTANASTAVETSSQIVQTVSTVAIETSVTTTVVVPSVHPTTTSAPPSAGASQVAGSSMGALAIGMLAALFSL